MKIERLCGFCINEWHFTTMILPYLNERINENYMITTILEKNIEENIKTLTAKLNLKNKEKIRRINWNRYISKKYKDIQNTCNNILEQSNKEKGNILLIYGSKEYIDVQNRNIKKWVKENNKKEYTIKIVNCYDITDIDYNVNEVLNCHDKIINTSGEKDKKDVFEGYGQKEDKAKII